MPNETTTPAPDTRDAQIADLKKQVEDLEKKLKAKTPAPPAKDYCVLGGKTYDVAGTVSAKFATDEARKGNYDLDAELVILKR